MKYAFLQQIKNPLPPAHVDPLSVWQKNIINDMDAERYAQDGWIILNEDDYDTFLSASPSYLRINSILEDQFKVYHPSKIDFRRHLKPNVYLRKNVIMLPNGRPERAVYTYQDVEMGEIKFTFEVDQFNFMVRRMEHLAYYRIDGALSEYWLIADDIYNKSNPYHLREMMRERSGARENIIEEVKAVMNGVLAAFYVPQGKTYPEILTIAGAFWSKYSNDIDSWINVGSPSFRTNLVIETEFDFLEALVAPDVTVRNYVLNKTSY